MRDTDKVLGKDAFGTSRPVHDDDEIKRLKTELLKTKLELDKTRTAYKQSRDESKQLKKLLMEVQQQNSKEKRLSYTVGNESRVDATTGMHQTNHNQMNACRCQELEQEVASLHSVLEIRMAELHEVRRQCATAEQDAKQLPVALKANMQLKFQIECLKAQLETKSSNEHFFSQKEIIQEKKPLVSSIRYESDQNRRLSLCNEELQWKLRHNVAPGYRSSPLLKPVAQSTPTPMGQRDGDCQSRSSEPLRPCLRPSNKENLISQSPQVYGVVEKDASISWIIDMKEQEEEDSVSTCSAQQSLKFNKKLSTNCSKFSPDQVKTPKTCLTSLRKKKLLR